MPDTLSFSEIRARHAELLKAAPASGAYTLDQLAQVRSFVEAVRLAGRHVADDDDREYLRGLLTFWGNVVYNQIRTYPNINLELAIAGVAAMTGQEPPPVKAEPTPPRGCVGPGTVRRFLLSGLLVIIMLIVVFAVVFVGAGLFNRAAGSATGTPPAAFEATRTAEAVVAAPTSNFPATPTVVTAPTLPATGGGGGGSPFSSISVQLIKPEFGDTVPVGQPVEIGGTYSNLQAGWRLFYVITNFETGDSFILPKSLTIDFDGSVGVWTATTTFSKPGAYGVSIYVATSHSEIERLQEWADTAKIVASDEEYDGVIFFRDLSFFNAQ